jgi:serine/threonine protein kinase
MGSTVTQFESAEFHPQQRIGNYVLEKPLGSGGFAEVWQAADPDANRNVALKVFFDRVTRDPTVWTEIREEPKKQPEHERIVTIYYCHLDSDGGPGPYYVAMKLMQGGTLAERLERDTRLAPPEAVRVIRDVLEGLDYAHSRGIIHRDIKPTNILFDANGRAAVADFGIAKDLNKTGSTTVFGTLVGTVIYMSPEQGEGLPVTKASDIYSIGTVLYEMLSGKVPFDGPTDTAIIVSRSKNDPPPLRAENPEIPEKLEKVVLNCLERNLEHRYADCKSLIRALDWAMVTTLPPPPPPPPKPASLRKVIAIAAIASAVLLGGLIYSKMQPSAKAPLPLTTSGTSAPAVKPLPPTPGAIAPPVAGSTTPTQPGTTNGGKGKTTPRAKPTVESSEVSDGPDGRPQLAPHPKDQNQSLYNPK